MGERGSSSGGGGEIWEGARAEMPQEQEKVKELEYDDCVLSPVESGIFINKEKGKKGERCWA